MRVFKTKTFDRWAGKAGVTDGALLNAVAQMERGLIDADLGGNLFKQRVALPGRGKSGSTRTIVATRFCRDAVLSVRVREEQPRQSKRP